MNTAVSRLAGRVAAAGTLLHDAPCPRSATLRDLVGFQQVRLAGYTHIVMYIRRAAHAGFQVG
jgi:hypothetical protein